MYGLFSFTKFFCPKTDTKEGEDMLGRLQEKCDLFTQNRQVMQNGFTWDYPAVQGLSAVLCTVSGKHVDINQIRACRKVLRESLVEFGEVDGPALISAATMLALSGEPEKVLKKMLRLYQMFVDQGFHPSIYVMLTVLNIVKYTDEDQFEELVVQAVAAYEKVRTNAWFASVDITETYKEIFAIAFAEADTDAYIDKTKQCYERLNVFLPSWESVVMVTDGLLMNSSQAEKKCDYVIRLYHKLKEKGYEFVDDFEFCVLGVLALVCETTDTAVDDIIEVCNYLENQPVLKAFDGRRDQYLTYASILVEAQYIENIENQQYIIEFSSEVFTMMNISLIMNMAENGPKKWMAD